MPIESSARTAVAAVAAADAPGVVRRRSRPRLAVTPRTVRRDVDRLRTLGYPVDATVGVGGGYRLGAGAEMPPLLLDDAEVLAVAARCCRGATRSVTGLDDAATGALSKLRQVMPSRLRHRLDALTVETVDGPVPRSSVDAATLSDIALACHRSERLRFDYNSRTGEESGASASPTDSSATAPLVLLAWDIGRDDWRTLPRRPDDDAEDADRSTLPGARPARGWVPRHSSPPASGRRCGRSRPVSASRHRLQDVESMVYPNGASSRPVTNPVASSRCSAHRWTPSRGGCTGSTRLHRPVTRTAAGPLPDPGCRPRPHRRALQVCERAPRRLTRPLVTRRDRGIHRRAPRRPPGGVHPCAHPTCVADRAGNTPTVSVHIDDSHDTENAERELSLRWRAVREDLVGAARSSGSSISSASTNGCHPTTVSVRCCATCRGRRPATADPSPGVARPARPPPCSRPSICSMRSCCRMPYAADRTASSSSSPDPMAPPIVAMEARSHASSR